jgi:hypothetical protein
MTRDGLRVSTYEVRVEYAAYEKKQEPEMILRNAEIAYRDRTFEFGQYVDIMTHSWDKDEGGDPKIVDWIQLYNPEVWMHRGMMSIRGFLQIVRLKGIDQNKENRHGDAELPMRMGKLWLRPETAITDDGKWLKDQPPGKKAK